MYISHIELKNWKNFKKANVSLQANSYLLGANATGKSNFLDVLRFLRDISKTDGGGLQKAITSRGGISKIRCLHAREDPEVKIEIQFKNDLEDVKPSWIYVLAFKNEAKGLNRNLVTHEEVIHNGKSLFKRPNKQDNSDDALRTQTHLEQISTNKNFRPLAEFFEHITYLHLVPQLLKFSDSIGGRMMEDDPFGQGFLERIAKCPMKTRSSRINKIQKILHSAIPQFAELRFITDSITGRPHLEGRYIHYRPNAGWQREEHFSDGTLRLIGLLWSLLENNSLLLIEEPELSLNDEIVSMIPALFAQAKRLSRKSQQIIISTHSQALLDNKSIDARGILLLEPTKEGTVIRSTNKEENTALLAGLSVADVILPKAQKLQQYNFKF